MILDNLKNKTYENELFKRYIKKFRLDLLIKGLYIYNTVKIEGNTFSKEDTIALLNNKELSEKYSASDMNEIIDLNNALDFMYESLDISTLDEDFIQELHSYVTESNEQALPGMFKIDPNYSSYNGNKFYYADPDEVVPKLRMMCGNYNRSDMTIEDIALMIAEFTSIHPFRDGNGRVQRLLLNWALIKNDFPPIIIEYAEKDDYIYALNEYRVSADLSDFLGFLECKLKIVYSCILEKNE